MTHEQVMNEQQDNTFMNIMVAYVDNERGYEDGISLQAGENDEISISQH